MYYSVLHHNTRSALSKEDSIAQFLGQFLFQFKIMFAEKWYRDDCALLHLDGYRIFFINCPYRRGGGVAVYVEAGRHFEPVSDFCKCTCDYEILTLKCNQDIVSVVYRPPDGNIVIFITFFETLLNYSSNNFNFICGGDFNNNVLDSSPIVHDFTTCIESNGFTNVITSPTHITQSTSSALDLLITKVHTVLDAGTIVSDISDHCPVLILYSSGTKTERRTETVTTQYDSPQALECFKLAISSHDWSCVLNQENANDEYLYSLKTSYKYTSHISRLKRSNHVKQQENHGLHGGI